jgi:hypothetical protein
MSYHKDDRVRAIALAMGMVPILWTGTPSGTFDTNGEWAMVPLFILEDDRFCDRLESGCWTGRRDDVIQHI